MDERCVIVGQISGLYGVKGWVKVFSDTRPQENIFRYSPWYLRRTDQDQDNVGKYEVAEDRVHGKGLIARFGGIDDRDAAAKLVGAEILVAREQFAGTKKDEYYWADLVGLQVRTADERVLGTVKSLMETGANDVLVIDGDRRRLVPFVLGPVVKEVDLDTGTIVVDWDPDF